MTTVPPLVSALREIGDRPALITGPRTVSGSALLTGAGPQYGLPEAIADCIARQLSPGAGEGDPREHRFRYWMGILGPPPIRHSILWPAGERGVDLAIATLLAGGTVICGDPEESPSALLSELARSRTTHLSLPSALLWRLIRTPDLSRHDLGSLRRVLHIGPEPRQDDVYAAVEGLGAVLAHVRETSDRETADNNLSDVMATAAATAWKQVIGVTAEKARAFSEHFETAVLSSMLLALQRGGVLNNPARSHSVAEILDAARVAPEHHPLVGRWLHVLTEHGLITRHDSHSYSGRPVETAAVIERWKHASEAWTGQLGSATVVDHLRRCAELLPRLLAGEPAALSQILRRGSARIADALEWKTATGRYLMTALRTAVLDIAISHEGPGPLRVLEIGTGGTVSASLTRTLAAEDDLGVAVELLCAEASDLLLRAARAGVAKRSRVRFQLFDLEGDSPEQDFSPGSFDVIICAGTLASAGDPASAARRLAGLLAPGGWLLMSEPTREHYEFLISGAFLPHSAGDARTAPGGAPLSRRRWLDALAGAGMGPVLTLPDDGHPLAALGHQLVAARLL